MSSPTAEHPYHPAFAQSVEGRLEALELWRRRSRLIKRLRWGLPLAMAALLALLLGWAAFNTLIQPMGFGTAPNSATSIRMINPRFYGRDHGGKAFSVAAAFAVRDNNQFQRIYVEKPMLVLGALPGPATQVSADKGVYREDTRMLTLDGNVHVHDSQGNDFLTSHAVIDTKTDDIEGPVPVAGHGPLGRIASASYAVHNGGAQILFSGKVVARIEQSGAAKPPAIALKGPR
jgi:lipopolysaccharide export system protein LptC